MKRLSNCYQKGGECLAKFLASEHPGLLAIAFGLGPLLGTLVFLLLALSPDLEPWQGSFQFVWRNSASVNSRFWIDVVLIYICWPMSVLLVHPLVRIFGLQASLKRELLVTGKVWMLSSLACITWLITTMGLVSIGWVDFARVWYVVWFFLIFGGMLFRILTAATKAIYGSSTQWACSIIFISCVACLLFVTSVLSIIGIILLRH